MRKKQPRERERESERERAREKRERERESERATFRRMASGAVHLMGSLPMSVTPNCESFARPKSATYSRSSSRTHTHTCIHVNT